MIQISFTKITPAKVEKLRSWMAEAQGRAEEVRETFRQETVRHEQAYLIQEADQHIFVCNGAGRSRSSPTGVSGITLKIDHAHREVIADVVEEILESELLYDVHL